MACGILVPQHRIEPTPPVVEVWNLNYWTTKEVPHNYLGNIFYGYIFFSVQDAIKGSYIAFSYHISLIFFSLEQPSLFLNLSLKKGVFFEYSWFTMLCQFQVCSEMNHLHINI